MSTFKGIIAEFPHIAVDMFKNDGSFSQTKAYFLSHAHKDHTQGLSEYSKKKPLRQLQTECIPELPGLTVTTLEANHCPGSSMFLFEGVGADEVDARVLYTGDFRYEMECLSQDELAALDFLSSRDIDNVYLDTTFADPSYSWFPIRSESSELVVRKIRELLEQYNHHISVHLRCTMYGYERLLRAIAEAFDMKIHVDNKLTPGYASLPGMEAVVTNDPLSTRLHSCPLDKGAKETVQTRLRLPCSKASAAAPTQHAFFRFGAMWFANKSASDPYVQRSDPNHHFYRAAMSIHSSYGELCEFLRRTRPRQVTPCVVSDKTTEEAIKRIFAPYLLGASPREQPSVARLTRISSEGSSGIKGTFLCRSASVAVSTPRRSKFSFLSNLSSDDEYSTSAKKEPRLKRTASAPAVSPNHRVKKPTLSVGFVDSVVAVETKTPPRRPITLAKGTPGYLEPRPKELVEAWQALYGPYVKGN